MPEEEKESEDPALGSGGRQRKEQVSNRIKKSFLFLRAIIKVGIIAGVSVFVKYFWSCFCKGNRSYKV